MADALRPEDAPVRKEQVLPALEHRVDHGAGQPRGEERRSGRGFKERPVVPDLANANRFNGRRTRHPEVVESREPIGRTRARARTGGAGPARPPRSRRSPRPRTPRSTPFRRARGVRCRAPAQPRPATARARRESPTREADPRGALPPALDHDPGVSGSALRRRAATAATSAIAATGTAARRRRLFTTRMRARGVPGQGSENRQATSFLRSRSRALSDWRRPRRPVASFSSASKCRSIV
jgi:hypothetical protein